MDTNSYYPLVGTYDVYKHISHDLKKCFFTSDCDESRRNRPLPARKKIIKQYYINKRWEGCWNKYKTCSNSS